jgi:hypothetical protein
LLLDIQIDKLGYPILVIGYHAPAAMQGKRDWKH